MSASTSPLPYTGNKSCIVNTILTVMPKHNVYIEPCMGSAEVFFRKPKAEREILNDYNGDLVNLFRTIFNWLDAEGKGSHVLAMRYSQKGCFDCLFRDKGEFTTKNKVTYADGTERVIGNGCGGSFSPYGNNVLARNTVLALSVLQAILDGSITRNTIASIRNEFTSLVSSISMTPVIDEDFAEEGCDICGNI